MNGSYTPQPGSAAFQAVEYFTTHPKDELTTEQLATKFDRPAKQWHSLLSLVTQHGILSRRPNEDSELVYSLGKGCPDIAPAPARHPSSRTEWLVERAQIRAKPSLARARSLAPDFDIAAIPLRDGVPLPGAMTGKSKWPALLARMAVGQSCVLPKACKGGVGSAVTHAKKDGKVFAIRILNDKEIGLWRVS